jgi:Ribonuclease G/E
MATLGADMDKFNATSKNTMEQFNVSEKNRGAALDANNQIEVDKINATISSEISKFNATLEDSREKWNAANAQAVEASNVEWKRHANTMDTAAQNAANATNVANAFGLSSRDSAFLWQELRDNMNKDFSRELTTEERKVSLINSAMQSEKFMTDGRFEQARKDIFKLAGTIFGVSFSIQ